MTNPNSPEPRGEGSPPLGDADYQNLGKVASRVAANRGVHRDDIEDIAQETLFSVVKHVKDGGELPNPEGFTSTIAWRRVTDQRRHERRHPIGDLPDDPGYEVQPFETFISGGLSAEDEVLIDPVLLDVLGSLPETQQTALLLEAEGYPREVIAERVGTNTKALKSMMNRARKAVAKGLEEQENQGQTLDPAIADRLHDQSPGQQR